MKCYYKAQHGNQFVVIADHDNHFKVSIVLMTHLNFFPGWMGFSHDFSEDMVDGRIGKLGPTSTKPLSV